MASSQNSASSSAKDVPNNELIKNLDATQKGFDKLPKVTVKDLVELIPAIFMALKDILNKLDVVTQLKNDLLQQNNDLQKEIKSLKGEVLDMQYDSVKNRIRINGLKATENENHAETTAVFDKLLTDLDIPTCSYSEIWRIPPKKIPGKPATDPTMIVTFKDFENKSMFFRNLKYLKQLKQYKIFVNSDYPAALVPQLKELEAAAKVHRDNGLKTKINYERGGVLTLSTKAGTLAWIKQ